MFGFWKGKIDIKLIKYGFAPGETIEGTLLLRLKKPQSGREVSIELVEEEHIRENHGGKTHYRTQKVFEFKQPLDGEKNYPQQMLSYPFKIKIPESVKQSQLPQDTLGRVVRFAQMFSNSKVRTEWYLLGRFDVKGFDITKKVKINVA